MVRFHLHACRWIYIHSSTYAGIKLAFRDCYRQQQRKTEWRKKQTFQILPETWRKLRWSRSHVNPSATMTTGCDTVSCVFLQYYLFYRASVCVVVLCTQTQKYLHTRVNTRRRGAMLFLCFGCCTCSDSGQNLNKILLQVFVSIPAWCLLIVHISMFLLLGLYFAVLLVM